MKLVNIHKLSIIIAMLFYWNSTFAQQWTLQQCIDSALVLNKNIQMANNNIALGEQKQKEAKANLIPKLIANADYKYFTDLPHQLMPMSTFNPAAAEGTFKAAQFGVPHNIGANLQLAIPVYNPQLYGGIEMTKIASEINVLQLEKSQEQISFDIANLYYNAQILQAQTLFLEGNLVNANKLLSNLKLLNEQLLATGTDVEKVALQVAQLNTQKNILSSKTNQILNALKFAIGIESNSDFEIETAIFLEDENTYKNKTSIDTRMLEIQNKLLKSELKTLNFSRFLPSINIVGSYGTTGFGYDKEPNAFLDFYAVGFAGLQVSYPIFNGTVTYRKTKQKQIEIENNELKNSLVEDQNAMQIANARLQRSSTFETIETTKQQIKQAQNIYNNTILQQKQGVASLTEVLLADNALREAQQANLSAIIDYLKADLELKKLTGNI